MQYGPAPASPLGCGDGAFVVVALPLLQERPASRKVDRPEVDSVAGRIGALRISAEGTRQVARRRLPARAWASTEIADGCVIRGADVIRAAQTPLKQDCTFANCGCSATWGQRRHTAFAAWWTPAVLPHSAACCHAWQDLPCTCSDSLFAGAVAQYHANRAQPAAGVHERSLQGIWLRLC